MNLLFGLMGAVLGSLLGNLPTALCMALVGGAIGWRWRAGSDAGRSPQSEFDAATLLRRVVALERELGALRKNVSELRPGAAPEPADTIAAAATPPPAPATAPAAEPAPAAARPAGVAAAPAVAAVRPAAIDAPPRRAPVAPAPAVPLRDRLPPFVARWIFGGNTIVKAGVLILFLGLAFLLRYTAERVTVPVELRYAGVALVGVVLTAIGWRLRDRRDAAGGNGYGVILQGAGIGIFYLTTLAALRLHPLLPPDLAFAFMALVAAFGAVLAVLQDAPWLAFVSIAEGFAAPALVSTGSDA
ncbi:MAG TPA: DUF2339 domain-containing protein, partial [Burkholderiaceae bacterium]|nr:DUF2339 domain-containing protein [Burkholderiaceae bacterium]